MMILLDTCTLLWLATSQEKISKKALDTIRDSQGTIFISAISSFEIAIKIKKKKLYLKKNPLDWYSLALELHGINEIPISSKILVESTILPEHHRDPADRIIIATAKLNGLAVISADQTFKKYRSIKTIW